MEETGSQKQFLSYPSTVLACVVLNIPSQLGKLYLVKSSEEVPQTTPQAHTHIHSLEYTFNDSIWYWQEFMEMSTHILPMVVQTVLIFMVEHL